MAYIKSTLDHVIHWCHRAINYLINCPTRLMTPYDFSKTQRSDTIIVFWNALIVIFIFMIFWMDLPTPSPLFLTHKCSLAFDSCTINNHAQFDRRTNRFQQCILDLQTTLYIPFKHAYPWCLHKVDLSSITVISRRHFSAKQSSGKRLPIVLPRPTTCMQYN